MAPNKEKHHSKSRARRHSGEIVIHSSSRKSKKEKDADTDSQSSSSSSETIVVPPPPEKKCPLRFILTGLLGTENQEKNEGCPLRRVQLWHTIPLCLLAVVNLLFIIIALLGLASYRIAIGTQGFVLNLLKTDLDVDDAGSVVTDVTPTTMVEDT